LTGNETGAIKRYPRLGIVSMNAEGPRESPTARRNSATVLVSADSLMASQPQTPASSASFDTTSPAWRARNTRRSMTLARMRTESPLGLVSRQRVGSTCQAPIVKSPELGIIRPRIVATKRTPVNTMPVGAVPQIEGFSEPSNTREKFGGIQGWVT